MWLIRLGPAYPRLYRSIELVLNRLSLCDIKGEAFLCFDTCDEFRRRVQKASSLDRTVRRQAFFPVGSSDCCPSAGKAFSRTAIQTD
jgi:hypothetical protein